MALINCPRLSGGFSWDFEKELKSLQSGSCLTMVQPELNRGDGIFRGGRVTVSHDDTFLYFVAELEDADIYNSATTLNEKTWTTGDVFEVFLKPESQEAYYEFHVTPENQHMQLRIESSAVFYAKKPREEGEKIFRDNLIVEQVIESRTEILREAELWRIMASIPLARISENKKWEPSDIWLVSFCRYDCTRGIEKPVFSSIAPMGKPDFHKQDFWSRLVFNSDKALA